MYVNIRGCKNDFIVLYSCILTAELDKKNNRTLTHSLPAVHPYSLQVTVQVCEVLV